MKYLVQAPDAVVMVRPHRFRPNPATVIDNHFQASIRGSLPEEVAARAFDEVTRAADQLRQAGIEVRLFEDETEEALALAAHVDRSYYGAVERGERNVTFTVLCRLCLALQCDVANLTENLPPQS